MQTRKKKLKDFISNTNKDNTQTLLPHGQKAFIFFKNHDDSIIFKYLHKTQTKTLKKKLFSFIKMIFHINKLQQEDIQLNFPPQLASDIKWNRIGVSLKYKSIRRFLIYFLVITVIGGLNVAAFFFIKERITHDLSEAFQQTVSKTKTTTKTTTFEYYEENFDFLLIQFLFTFAYFIIGQFCISGGAFLMRRVLNTQKSAEIIQGIKIEIIIHLVYYIIFPFILLRLVLNEPQHQHQTAKEQKIYDNLIMNTIVKSIFYNQILSIATALIDFRVLLFRLKLKKVKKKQKDQKNNNLEMMTQIQLNEYLTPPIFNIDKYLIILL